MLLSDYDIPMDHHPDEVIVEPVSRGCFWYVTLRYGRTCSLSLPPNLLPAKKVYALEVGNHYVYLRDAGMWEVWEVWEHDGVTEKIAKIDAFRSLEEAKQEAVRCARPGIEIISPDGHLISHQCNADGSWTL